jgi:mannose-6-phosphate isomerase-like protein (cupin superfamily)
MKKIYELNDLLSELEERNGCFLDFITTKGIQAGIIRLRPFQKDTQAPHSVDEVYYVIEGSGFIEIDNKNYAITERTSVFVPAGAEHRFHGNNEDLVILYALGSDISGGS